MSEIDLEQMYQRFVSHYTNQLAAHLANEPAFDAKTFGSFLQEQKSISTAVKALFYAYLCEGIEEYCKENNIPDGAPHQLSSANFVTTLYKTLHFRMPGVSEECLLALTRDIDDAMRHLVADPLHERIENMSTAYVSSPESEPHRASNPNHPAERNERLTPAKRVLKTDFLIHSVEDHERIVHPGKIGPSV